MHTQNGLNIRPAAVTPGYHPTADTLMFSMPSRVDPFELRGIRYFVKRDDLIDPLFSGNKFRKLQALLDTPASRYARVISWGGNQSNAMLSIAALCARKDWRFEYTTKTIPARIREHPTGNLKQALALGMILNEVKPKAYATFVAEAGHIDTDTDADTLVLAQGGADPLARAGIEQLAAEIRQWQADAAIPQLHVVTPSGTGTTAAMLASALPEVTVLTTPAVGDAAYLREQIERLLPMPENMRILETGQPFRFAAPAPELLAIYHELLTAGIEFDLIYGALMWHTLLQHADTIDGEIFYVHSGGVTGNETMLDRYHHLGMSVHGESE